LWG
jgi:hypothetical protein